MQLETIHKFIYEVTTTLKDNGAKEVNLDYNKVRSLHKNPHYETLYRFNGFVNIDTSDVNDCIVVAHNLK